MCPPAPALRETWIKNLQTSAGTAIRMIAPDVRTMHRIMATHILR
jgi:hypothetical protein